MLEGKIVLITGASSGIGMACARCFAAEGAKLLLCARRMAVLDNLAVQLKDEYGIEVYVFKLDVRKRQMVGDTLRALPAAWKKIDVLINNAGLAAGLESLAEGDVQDWEDMIDTNVKGILYVTREVLPGMIERGSGHIINIGSVSGHQVYPKGAVYCATKHALNAISQGLRMDLLDTKIRISTVDPGAVETNFSLIRFKGDKKRAEAVYEAMIPLSADDVASAVLYCVNCPPHVNISEIIIMPTAQVSATMVSRKGISIK